MDADSNIYDPWAALDAPEPSVAERFTWPLLLAFAWIVFELTASATLSLLIACLRFGMEDVRTAVWLRKTDPNPRRGRAAFWFYVSSGVWKTAVVPGLAVFVAGIVWGLLATDEIQHDAEVARQVNSALWVGLGSACVLVVTVAVAVGMTLSAGVRIWVHHDLHRSRRENQWPPHWPYPLWQHDNRGRPILATALIVLTITMPIVLFPLAVLLAEGAEITAVLFLVFGIPIGATFAYAVLRDRLFAQTPDQCWPESTFEHPQLTPETWQPGTANATR